MRFVFPILLALPLLAIEEERYPNRVYIGPDVFYRNYHEILPSPRKSDEYGTLAGFQLGYDYVKNNRIYIGGDIRLASGKTTYDGSMLLLETMRVIPCISQTKNLLTNMEGRVGYTLAASPSSSFYIPLFSGIGCSYWKRDIGYIEKYSWDYVVYGLRPTYRFSLLFELGLNLELMQMFNGKIIIDVPDSGKVTLDLGNQLQYAAELPIRVIFPRSYHFDLSIIPYYRRQDLGESNSKRIRIRHVGKVYIQEPASTSYQVGARAEAGYRF